MAVPDSRFVHVCDDPLVRDTLGPAFRGRVVQSFIARLPGARRHYQKYLPLTHWLANSLTSRRTTR